MIYPANLRFILVFWLLCLGHLLQSQIKENGKNDIAIDTIFYRYQQELRQAKQSGKTKNRIEKHIQLGGFYHEYGLYAEAIKQFNEGLILGNKERDSLFCILNNNIGEVYLDQNNFDLARDYLEQAATVSKALGYERGLARAKALLGFCFEKTGAYEKALLHQQESLNLFTKLHDSSGIALTYENMGSVYEDLEDFSKASAYFKMAYLFIKDKKTREEAVVLNNLGDVFRKEGDYENALEYTYKALRVAENLKDKHQLKSAYKDLSKTYALKNDFEAAYAKLELHLLYNEEWIANQNERQLNVLGAMHEANKMEARIALLQEQNKVSKANQKLLWFALFFSTLLLVALYVFLERKRRTKLKIQGYEQLLLKTELEKKENEERNLQREIQIKVTALSRYSLHLSQKNRLLATISRSLMNLSERKNMDTSKRLKSLANEIAADLEKDNEWEEFQDLFKEIHPDFTKKLLQLSQNTLSPAELRLGMLLRLNLSSKEIASITHVTPDSIRVARYRLRRKLPIDQKEELATFLIEL